MCKYYIFYILYRARAVVFHRNYFLEVTSHTQCIYKQLFIIWCRITKKKTFASCNRCVAPLRDLFVGWQVFGRVLFLYHVDDNVPLLVKTAAFRGEFGFYLLCLFLVLLNFFEEFASSPSIAQKMNVEVCFYLCFMDVKGEYCFSCFSSMMSRRLKTGHDHKYGPHGSSSRYGSGQCRCENVFSSSIHLCCRNGSAYPQSIWSLNKRME